MWLITSRPAPQEIGSPEKSSLGITQQTGALNPHVTPPEILSERQSNKGTTEVAEQNENSWDILLIILWDETAHWCFGVWTITLLKMRLLQCSYTFCPMNTQLQLKLSPPWFLIHHKPSLLIYSEALHGHVEDTVNALTLFEDESLG
ncbi:hypothetical protein J5N97_007531 [Dioscorea zingiberensis]|uniref:Uncharacterized protein n=1 Tax=Dioscorea zingiberensis TaxID=325984 RepID=A0A9D5HTP1_9LILI|nr:hypothetical protein J5N97_007531 [Dioscorea zingiberensis]